MSDKWILSKYHLITHVDGLKKYIPFFRDSAEFVTTWAGKPLLYFVTYVSSTRYKIPLFYLKKNTMCVSYNGSYYGFHASNKITFATVVFSVSGDIWGTSGANFVFAFSGNVVCYAWSITVAVYAQRYGSDTWTNIETHTYYQDSDTYNFNLCWYTDARTALPTYNNKLKFVITTSFSNNIGVWECDSASSIRNTVWTLNYDIVEGNDSGEYSFEQES